MKKCNKCHVDIQAHRNYCPLCYNDVESAKTPDNPLLVERTTNDNFSRKGRLVSKIFLIISIAIVTICAYINFSIKNTYLWSMIVLASILYLWILVAHTIISKRNVFEKITFQLVGIVGIIGTTYALTPVPQENWLVCYVLPAVSILVTTVLLLISFAHKNRKQYLLSFVGIYLALMILSIVLLCTIDKFKLLNQIALILTALSSGGTILLGHRSIRKEFAKIFHL